MKSTGIRCLLGVCLAVVLLANTAHAQSVSELHLTNDDYAIINGVQQWTQEIEPLPDDPWIRFDGFAVYGQAVSGVVAAGQAKIRVSFDDTILIASDGRNHLHGLVDMLDQTQTGSFALNLENEISDFQARAIHPDGTSTLLINTSFSLSVKGESSDSGLTLNSFGASISTFEPLAGTVVQAVEFTFTIPSTTQHNGITYQVESLAAANFDYTRVNITTRSVEYENENSVLASPVLMSKPATVCLPKGHCWDPTDIGNEGTKGVRSLCSKRPGNSKKVDVIAGGKSR